MNHRHSQRRRRLMRPGLTTQRACEGYDQFAPAPIERKPATSHLESSWTPSTDCRMNALVSIIRDCPLSALARWVGIGGAWAAMVESLGRLLQGLQASHLAQQGLTNALATIPSPNGQSRIISRLPTQTVLTDWRVSLKSSRSAGSDAHAGCQDGDVEPSRFRQHKSRP